MHLRGERALAREVWTLAWPAAARMLLVTLVFMANRAMLGAHSATALASMQISGTLLWTLYSVLSASSAGTLAAVARSHGAGDKATAARAARVSVLTAFGLGLLVVVPIWIGNGALLQALFPKAGPEVIVQSSQYLHIVLPCLPLSFLEAIAAASLQGAGDTKTPLQVAVVGNMMHLVVSAVFIFGAFGLPRMGIRGAALGMASTFAVEGILLTAALFSKSSPLPMRTAAWRHSLFELRRIVRISVPAFFEKLFYQTGDMGFIAILGLLGPLAMAGNQALVSIEAICFLLADGFGIAAGAVMAQKLGAKSPGQASRAGLISAGTATLLLSFFGILFALFPRALLCAFSRDAAVIELGHSSLYVAAAAQPFMAFATVMSMGLRGAGDTKTVLGITFVCSIVVRLCATWLFAISLELGLLGIWLGSTADWVVRSLLLGIAFLRGGWRKVEV